MDGSTIFLIVLCVLWCALILIVAIFYNPFSSESFLAGCVPYKDCSCQSPVPSQNPFFPIDHVYVQPSLKTNIDRVIQKVSDPVVKKNLETIATQPSAYWIDVKEKIDKEVKDILDDMKTDQKVVFIVYDLPNRDCKALSSNGQICCNTQESCASFCSIDCQKTASNCDEGLSTYKTQYIDKLVSLFQQYPHVQLILIIEPDSIPNCVTNLGIFGCTTLTCDVYSQGVSYALQQFSTLPNVVMYLDAAHGGWLGWSDNLSGFQKLVSKNKWTSYLRGFSTNVSNYQPLGKPCSFPTTTSNYNDFIEILKKETTGCGYDPCGLTSQYNAGNNESNYVQLLSWIFQHDTFKTEDGHPRFVIDTGRNGNPDARFGSTSCAVWCNVNKARIGVYPTTDTLLPKLIDAYFWLKTPGESDGCIDYDQQKKCDNTDGFGSKCIRYDQNCGTHPENVGYDSSQPCPPEAGAWFDYQILMLAGADLS